MEQGNPARCRKARTVRTPKTIEEKLTENISAEQADNATYTANTSAAEQETAAHTETTQAATKQNDAAHPNREPLKKPTPLRQLQPPKPPQKKARRTALNSPTWG